MPKPNIAVFLLLVLSLSAAAYPTDWPGAWPKSTFLGLDELESASGELEPAADIFSCYFEDGRIRVRLPMMVDFSTGENRFRKKNVSLDISISGGARADVHVGPSGRITAAGAGGEPLELDSVVFLPKYGVIEAGIRPGEGSFAARPRVEVVSYLDGVVADRALYRPTDPTSSTNCAFLHHGNQSLSYTDVLRGRSGEEHASGFDEVLEAHQTYSIPGNFHMSGTIQSGAAWYDPDFNTWLSDGVTAGWVEMVSSAYAQHIMPFVEDNMNDWSVSTEGDMVLYRYGFEPRVAWVPERVFLDGPGGDYPNAGVSDYIADDFADNGIWAIVLDDDIHLNGYHNHQIHYLSGSSLRLIPRDNDFTGKLHEGDGAGALGILEGMASYVSGPDLIAVYADDWEMAAERGEWAGSMSDALDTYEWMMQQCSLESAWLSTWKLTDAVTSSDFNGETFEPDYGTHSSIGGADGYGGADNSWYTHWAGYASPSDNHDPQWNFGYIWSDARNNLNTAPDNNCAQSGWYVLMSNLYETGWHDGMGGPISGWEMKHSTHMKNANVYAEGARWAGGTSFTGTSAFYDDWDHDGDNELVIHSDRVCAVFEHIGGRAHWIFAKGGDSGWEGSIAGNCNAYWEGTEGDYNDANHIAPLSDVSVGGSDYEHNLYYSEILYSSTDSAEILLQNYFLRKHIKVKSEEPYLRVHYDSGPDFVYIKSGFTPDMVDILWNADIERLWSAGAYSGWYNPNVDAAAAIVMGGGGASHSAEVQSTILRGDEITGSGGFGFLIYAGELPDASGMTSSTLSGLAAGMADVYPPRAYYASYHPGTDVMEISFGDFVQFDAVTLSGIGVDSDGDGAPEVNLDGTSSVINTADSPHIRISLSSASASAIEALTMTDPYLHLAAGSFQDLAGNGNAAQFAGQDGVSLNVLPATSITIDGYIDPAEWDSAYVIEDPDDDSEWGTGNELYDLNIYWDPTYLYVGLHGMKETTPFTNAWLIYFDTDWGGPDGQTDLTGIDSWDRNAQFSGGFKADIQYGSWGDGDGTVWDITSATTSVQITEGVIVNTDLSADRPGSEIAISWDAIYGLGEGIVPSSANLALVASIAGQSDDDDLGGDCIPNRSSSAFPVLDSAFSVQIDGDGDGIPDDFDEVLYAGEHSPVKPDKISISASPNPFNSAVAIRVSGIAGEGRFALKIYDVNGRLVGEPAISEERSSSISSTAIWRPSPELGSGLYFARIIAGGGSATVPILYIK